MEKRERSGSFQSSNPWVTEDRITAAICNAIRLAERSGHLRTSRDETFDEMIHSHQTSSPSLHLIKQLKKITVKGGQLNKTNAEIQNRLMDKETSDITHIGNLESKISQLDGLTAHLQAIVQSKDQLIYRLQKPFVGDYLKIEATYHRDVKELFPLAAACLAELSHNLDTIEWASSFDLKDGKMDETLLGISTSLAQFQTSFQTICQLRQTLDSFETQAAELVSK